MLFMSIPEAIPSTLTAIANHPLPGLKTAAYYQSGRPVTAPPDYQKNSARARISTPAAVY
jgi:hypothetical protein